MPTNRTKRTRGRTGSGGLTEAALSYFWWNGTIPNNEFLQGKTEAEILKFWKKHRTAILEWYIEKNRQRKGDPGKRPEMFWQEITEERRKTGVEKWFGPVSADGKSREQVDDVFESDAQYLKRLNLLQGWELDYKPPEKATKRRKTE